MDLRMLARFPTRTATCVSAFRAGALSARGRTISSALRAITMPSGLWSWVKLATLKTRSAMGLSGPFSAGITSLGLTAVLS